MDCALYTCMWIIIGLIPNANMPSGYSTHLTGERQVWRREKDCKTVASTMHMEDDPDILFVCTPMLVRR